MPMIPKGRSLPLIVVLLLSVSAIFFYSHLSTTSIPPPILVNPNSDLTLSSSRRTSGFTLIIKVLAFNRLDSLSRCLRSLAAADYFSDTAHLHIYIDHFTLDDKSSNTDHDLDNSRRILEFVDGFKWSFGDKLVHYRTRNAGLQAQWLEAWWPSSDDEFAFIVEDDLEVSPLYYRVVRAVVRNYYYNASNFSPSIYGLTLQRARFVPGKHGNKIELDTGSRVFLYQLVGTWGQILFPRPWKEFRMWYDDHKAKGIKPLIDGMVTTGWYKRLGEKIWTPWFIKFIHSHGYFNIYTNFLQESALSVSHRDAGVNYAKTAGPDSQLLDNKSIDFDSLDLQPLSNLKWYDFCFQKVFPGRVVRNSHDLASVIPSVQRNQTVILVNLFQVPESVVRNLLCHFERLNIRNYILAGPLSDFLMDLARRGHTVIGADKFLDSVGAHNPIASQDSGVDQLKGILVKAYFVKKCMELKYNNMLVDGNMIFDSVEILLQQFDVSFDITYGKNMGILFVPASSGKRLADIFVQEAEAVVSSMRNEITLHGWNKRLLDMVTEALQRKGARIKRVEDRSITANILENNIKNSSINVHGNILYWPHDTSTELIQKQLGGAGIWYLDTDSSCKAVICHRS
ncbi:hypothetical protein SAY86_026703 [Trapa natans]|uniref:Uncharacterized protein n=1 Tax=Trapa natans TaxID=22666 RepID=A0AAN7KB89_TRANT|nr:hypothetical protein SAY86_026703 [Trapa natans]